MSGKYSREIPKIAGCVLLLTVILIIVMLLIGLAIIAISDRVYTQYFETMDNAVIEKSGIAEINFIVNESIASGNGSQRLNKIADLIINNYNDPVVAPNYPLLPNSARYWYDENGQIRIIPVDIELDPHVASVAQKLATNPNWLIYQKFGACRELSVIFSHISNKSGFSSRIVRTGNGQEPFGKGATHWWNEIEKDGINKTFDVQWYLQIKTNMSQGVSWSGNRSDYMNNSDGFSPQQLCSWGGVWITDDQGLKIEDITQDYMGSYNCSWLEAKTTIKPIVDKPYINIFRRENRTIGAKVLLYEFFDYFPINIRENSTSISLPPISG